KPLQQRPFDRQTSAVRAHTPSGFVTLTLCIGKIGPSLVAKTRFPRSDVPGRERRRSRLEAQGGGDRVSRLHAQTGNVVTQRIFAVEAHLMRKVLQPALESIWWDLDIIVSLVAIRKSCLI